MTLGLMLVFGVPPDANAEFGPIFDIQMLGLDRHPQLPPILHPTLSLQAYRIKVLNTMQKAEAVDWQYIG